MKVVNLLSLAFAGVMCAAGSVSAQKKAATPVKKAVVAKAAGLPAGFKAYKGINYKMINDAPGPTPQAGDILKMHVRFKVGKGTAKDSLLLNSYTANQGQPFEMPLVEPKFRGDVAEVFSLMSAGDSAVVWVSIDSLKKILKDQPMPPFAKKGDYFIYEIKMVSVMSKEEAEKAATAKKAEQNVVDDKALQAYFADNKITPSKTQGGVYYTIATAGTGDNIADGKTVSLKYTGKLLDGTAFDSNVDPKFGHADQPFTIQIGTHSVIPGMEDAIHMFKNGAKGVMYIPSSLAYGAQSPSPAIPANSVMVFEVEVTEVK